jgi:hypothetical protein
MYPGSFSQDAQVTSIGGQDVVAGGSQAYHRGINGIGVSASGQQHLPAFASPPDPPPLSFTVPGRRGPRGRGTDPGSS